MLGKAAQNERTPRIDEREDLAKQVKNAVAADNAVKSSADAVAPAASGKVYVRSIWVWGMDGK